MTILLKQAHVFAPSSPYHGQVHDVLLEQGKITAIAPNLSVSADQMVTSDELWVSAGWMDLFCQSGEPGFESTETLNTLSKAALAGGFTEVLLTPNLLPVTDKEQQIRALQNQTMHLPVRFYPMGAVTRQIEGKELAEMYEMEEAGSPAFTDGWRSIQSAGLLVKALQYLLPTQKTIIQIPDDQTILPHGQMHEGTVSTQLGLPGRPLLAEYLRVMRDIELVRYTGGKIHFTGITCLESLEQIRAAKAQGLPITCSVSPAHLFWSDEDLRTYNSHLKLNPPLRPVAHRDALREALLDGTVDAIASHHHPHLDDHKSCEFEYAKPGMIALESAFSLSLTAVGRAGLPAILQAFTSGPRAVLGFANPPFEVGAPANLTWFDPTQSITYQPANRQSRSQNSPAFELPLQGKVLGAFNAS